MKLSTSTVLLALLFVASTTFADQHGSMNDTKIEIEKRDQHGSMDDLKIVVQKRDQHGGQDDSKVDVEKRQQHGGVDDSKIVGEKRQQHGGVDDSKIVRKKRQQHGGVDDSKIAVEKRQQHGSVDDLKSGVKKRQQYYQGTGTYYYPDVGVGACGVQYYSSDQVVALPTSLFDNGAHCGQWITIWATADSANVGASQGAIVGDECPTCEGLYGIDMSPRLFELFADLSEGEVPVEYFFQ